MKKNKYTAKQITEAIAYWSKQLKKMNESEGDADMVEFADEETSYAEGPYDNFIGKASTVAEAFSILERKGFGNRTNGALVIGAEDMDADISFHGLDPENGWLIWQTRETSGAQIDSAKAASIDIVDVLREANYKKNIISGSTRLDTLCELGYQEGGSIVLFDSSIGEYVAYNISSNDYDTIFDAFERLASK